MESNKFRHGSGVDEKQAGRERGYPISSWIYYKRDEVRFAQPRPARST